MDFGKKVQMLRKTHGLSQETLANILNINRNNLSRIETGKSEPNLSVIRDIAKYFNMGDLVAMTAPMREIVVSGNEDNGFLLAGAINSVAVGRLGYEALGAGDNLVHVIAPGPHRFFAKESYPHIHRMIEEL